MPWMFPLPMAAWISSKMLTASKNKPWGRHLKQFKETKGEAELNPGSRNIQHATNQHIIH